MTQFSFRPPVAADAAAIVATVAEGLAGYREFTPPGWAPPPSESATTRLDEPTSWYLLAEADGAVAGHVAFMPAALHPEPDPDPELAHLTALFVREPFRGTGLAAELLRSAEREAVRRGFRRGRLFAAAGYARGRRFYEREGWRPVGAPIPAPHLHLDVIEYRRHCGGG